MPFLSEKAQENPNSQTEKANLDFISKLKILPQMVIRPRWKPRRGQHASARKTKQALHIGYWFQWGRANAKNSIRIKRAHNRSLWARLSCRCWREWSKPHTWKGCVTGAMIYKVRPKRQSFDWAKQTWLFLLGGRGIFFFFFLNWAKNYGKHLLTMTTEGVVVFIQGHFKGINAINTTTQS